jgi:hypothetical protein
LREYSGAAVAGALAVLSAAPGTRLQRFEVMDSRLMIRADLVDALLAKFGSSPAGASALVKLNMQQGLESQQADTLCSRLPSSLQDLQLMLLCSYGATAQPPSLLPPAAQQFRQLRRLVLQVMSVCPTQALDLAPLAACAATLQELWLDVPGGGGMRLQLLGISTLAGLSRLQRLQLPDECTLSDAGEEQEGAAAAWWQVLWGMQQLQELQAGLLDCSAEQWEQLAAWPGLRKLRLRSLDVGPVAQPSPLQHLTIRRELQLVCAGAGAGAGSLAQLLPRLQELEVRGAGSMGSWAAALGGHPSLQALSLPSAGWAGLGIMNQLQLSSCPQLRSVDLHKVSGCNADALLADLGQCSCLQSLRLGFQMLSNAGSASKITRQGALALAGGPAGQSLQSVWVNTGRSYMLGIDAAAALMAGPCRAPKVCLFGVQPEGEAPRCAEDVELALAQQLAHYGTLAVEGVTCDSQCLDSVDGCFSAQVQVAGKEVWFRVAAPGWPGVGL